MMMPLTCGRTSATPEATTRPGRIVVSVTSSAASVTTVTFAGGRSCASAKGVAMATRAVAARITASGRGISPNVARMCLRIDNA